MRRSWHLCVMGLVALFCFGGNYGAMAQTVDPKKEREKEIIDQVTKFLDSVDDKQNATDTSILVRQRIRDGKFRFGQTEQGDAAETDPKTGKTVLHTTMPIGEHLNGGRKLTYRDIADIAGTMKHEIVHQDQSRLNPRYKKKELNAWNARLQANAKWIVDMKKKHDALAPGSPDRKELAKQIADLCGVMVETHNDYKTVYQAGKVGRIDWYNPDGSTLTWDDLSKMLLGLEKRMEREAKGLPPIATGTAPLPPQPPVKTTPTGGGQCTGTGSDCQGASGSGSGGTTIPTPSQRQPVVK